ncbi:MAG: site-specific recombinase, partial [Pseudomonadota bacterium]
MSLNLILEGMALTPANRASAPLCELVAALRPKNPRDIAQATHNLQALCYLLKTQPALANALREYLVEMIGSRKLVHLMTDTGITKNLGFWSAVWQRIHHKWLPPIINDEYLKDVFGQIFCNTDDWHWVCGVDDALWGEFFRALNFRAYSIRPLHGAVVQELLAAVQVLSYRITAIGLEPELVRNHPAIERFESPFLSQNQEINNYLARYRDWLVERKAEREDCRHIDVLLAQCEDVLVKIQRSATRQGISVSLTRLLLRLTESISRLRTLLILLDVDSAVDTVPLVVRCFKELVHAENIKNNLSELFGSNTKLLAMQVTERAGRSGDHYVTSTRREWWDMLRSAAGGGFIVGFMATLKLLTTKLVLAPVGYAFLFSLNFASGFILVHMLHFAIATKQPAMTAARIAAAIDQGKQKLDDLADLVVRVIRSQLIAIVGNIALAVPTAYAIAWTWYGITGKHLADPAKAMHLLHEIDPFFIQTLPFAAIAGVFLFLAGLISGYYDNKAAYNDIPARLRQLPWLKAVLGEARLAKFTDYISHNLGALAGNFFFGIMLGTIGTLGSFFGLPLDIRHVTFGSANFAFAVVGLNHALSWQQVATSLSGIGLIGLTNLTVSFSLALMVALQSRRISFGKGR